MKIAIVTGASSGLGREFVLQIANAYELDAIWVIARREERLKELKNEVKTPVVPIALDITKPECIQSLADKLKAEQPDVRILVSCAGMGQFGPTLDIPVEDNDRTIDLNCKAAVGITTICFPYLSRGSQIIELASVAAFQPIPSINVYAASKAFLLRYSQALHYELLGKGIHVTAVCPYWVMDTEFIGKAKDTDKTGFKNFLFPQYTGDVVRRSLVAARLNFPVCTPGIVSTLDRIVTKAVPHAITNPFFALIRKM